jgi:hypothetical protein
MAGVWPGVWWCATVAVLVWNILSADVKAWIRAVKQVLKR